MTRRLLIAVLLAAQVLFGAGGAADGRRGNALYEEGQYAEAAAAYRAGLEALSDEAPAALRTGLWNNLGLALYRQENYNEARLAFEQAQAAATTDAAYARAAYNAGNTAAALGEVEAALDGYRQVLLRDPAHEDARFNYEFVQRRMKQPPPPPQQNSQPPPDIDPSAFARQLKARADTLVGRDQYGSAARLMTQGLQRDSTVAAYRDFMTRLRDVAQIDSAAGASPTP